MRKKANIFLILSILTGGYLLYGIYNVIKHISTYKILDYVIVVILYALIIKLEMFFFKKYKFHSSSEVAEKENKEENSHALPNFKSQKKIGWLIPVFIICILGLAVAYTAKNEDKLGAMQGGTIMKTASITKEQENEVITILKECGINKIQKIEHDSSLDGINIEGEKGYRLKAENIDNIILYITKDSKVNMVRWADNSLYENGKVISKITDFTLSNKEVSDLQVKCQNAVKSVLKSPSTAKFPNILEWKFAKNKEKIIVQSYVDSQNSFGAEVRSEFRITLSPDGNSVKSFILGGEEYIK
ncbi:hypothetical protein [Clostridium sp. OS1-26]|uniref:hypothetical protein n=1 Tax=Clostridium sp. OS1-26 TaxID=3070681 RepID=UPI0027E10D11|nr:hypothetical protein [Clostridium sp. OS1-26]WML35344.1 hypothetical protein RCG18_00845 [Clostridium sp. OS1-26]